VAGSPGKGNWAETPWVAVFDPLVTETAQRGYYIVYLFRGDGNKVCLSLNQGTTHVLENHGRAAYINVLRSQAQTYLALLPNGELDNLIAGPIDLGGGGTLTRGYEAGNVAAIDYEAGSIPDESQLAHDLSRFLDLYGVLVEARAEVDEDDDPAAVESAIAAGVEAARERWHKRTERNPRLIRDAKRHHGSTCMVCGFNFEETYGEVGTGFIEAHHLTPFAELHGRPTRLDPTTDFAVVCSNCHRMLHRQSPPLSLAALTGLLR
jgi:5-methylcytosine-specific restriction protein A